jgi:hypothetical protein
VFARVLHRNPLRSATRKEGMSGGASSGDRLGQGTPVVDPLKASNSHHTLAVMAGLDADPPSMADSSQKSMKGVLTRGPNSGDGDDLRKVI